MLLLSLRGYLDINDIAQFALGKFGYANVGSHCLQFLSTRGLWCILIQPGNSY